MSLKKAGQASSFHLSISCTQMNGNHIITHKKSPHLLKLVPHHLLLLRHGGGRERGGGGGWREQREIILALSQIWRRIQFCSCAIHTQCHWRTAADPRACARTNNSDSHGKKTQTSARKSHAHLLPDTGPVRRNPGAVLQLNPSPLHALAVPRPGRWPLTNMCSSFWTSVGLGPVALAASSCS